MSVLRATILCVAIGFGAVGAASGSDYIAPRASVAGHHHLGKMSGLTRELKIIWRKEERAHLKALPKEQRRGWIKAQWRSMSASQRQAKVAELQAKWNALPADVRQALLERKARRHEQHRFQKAQRLSGQAVQQQQPTQMQRQ